MKKIIIGLIFILYIGWGLGGWFCNVACGVGITPMKDGALSYRGWYVPSDKTESITNKELAEVTFNDHEHSWYDKKIEMEGVNYPYNAVMIRKCRTEGCKKDYWIYKQEVRAVKKTSLQSQINDLQAQIIVITGIITKLGYQFNDYDTYHRIRELEKDKERSEQKVKLTRQEFIKKVEALMEIAKEKALGEMYDKLVEDENNDQSKSGPDKT